MAKFSQNTLKIFEERYYQKDRATGEPVEYTPEDVFRRVARAVACPEANKEEWSNKFFDLMDRQVFMPNSPTLMNAGTEYCLSACSVLGAIPDSLVGDDSIFRHMEKNATLSKAGCGVGQSLHRLRPKNEIIKSTGGVSSGSVSFMSLINATAAVVKQGDKARRAANMVSQRFNHPDIRDFIHSKEKDGSLSGMNISVTITNEEIEAIRNDREIWLEWNGRQYDRVNARELFLEIVECAWKNGEPGIIFIDKINDMSPFSGPEHDIVTTNPCGEQPLEAFELCNLGSVNVSLYYDPVTNSIDYDKLAADIPHMVRFMDNIIEINHYPMKEFEIKTKAHRKIGIGLAGFAELLIKLGIRYDSETGLKVAEELMNFITDRCTVASHDLAVEKGVFPEWKHSKWANGYFVAGRWVFDKNGYLVRNSTITTIAPTGTISSFLGTYAFGIEPLFNVAYIRRVMDTELFEAIPMFEQDLNKYLLPDDIKKAIIRACQIAGTTNIPEVPEDLRKLYRCANDVSWDWHVRMQAAFQKHTHNAVSKTINMPETATKEDVYNAYMLAFDLDCKGITVYRNNSRANQTIQIGEKKKEEPQLTVSNDQGTVVKIDSEGVTITTPAGPARGEILPAPSTSFGVTEKCVTGCGNSYITVDFDENGDIVQTFAEKGSQGNCMSNQQAVSRLVSLALRGGISIDDIVDQLMSAPVCPNYMHAKGKGKQCSAGFSCPSAMANILKKYKDFMKTPERRLTKAVKIAATEAAEEIAPAKETGAKCPECGQTLAHESGCQTCMSCGWSKCD